MQRFLSRIRAFVVLILGVLSAHSGAAAEPVDVSATLAAIVARRDIPGMTAVVLRGDQIIAQGAAGVRKKDATAPVLLADKFGIASNVKPMSAVLLAMLIEEGQLRWDSTLGEVFGATLRGMKPGWYPVTLRQVMDHRSGLASDPMGLLLARTMFSTASPMRQRLDLAEHLLARAPHFPADTELAYTSSAYVILAAAMEQTTGRAWEDLMRERLFGPLGMASVGIGPPASPHQLDQPWGHGFRFHAPIFGWGRSDTPLDPASIFASVPRSVAPAGVVHMSAPDWAKFAALVLRGHPANPERHVALLNSESFERLYETDARGEVPKGWGDGRYSANWIVTTQPWAKGNRTGDVGRVLWNQGDDTRWHSTAYLLPELNFAVVLVCNRTRQWEAGHEVAEALIGEFAREGFTAGTGLGGHWEALAGGQRVLLELSGAGGGTRESTVMTPDQGADRVSVTTISEREGKLRIETARGGVFEGKLNGDQSLMEGRWTQGKFVRWVIFKRRAAN